MGRLQTRISALLLVGTLGCAETGGGDPNAGGGGQSGHAGSGGGGAAPAGTGGGSGGAGNAGGGAATGGAGAGGSAAGTGGGSGGSVSGGGGSTSGGGTSGGSGGMGQAGAAGAPTPTAGCGTALTEPLDEWVEGSLDVGGVTRRWWVRLPDGYQPERPYPVVFLFHGCGNETNNVPMQNVIDGEAVLVRGAAVDECWDTGRDTDDVAFFDAMLAAASERYCLDGSRVFAAGYSSGSWLINLLECVRGDVLRAAGSVAGGTPYQPACVGTVARVFVHDLDDLDNAIAGNVTERDRLIELNGCDPEAPPVPEQPAPCVRYQGCDPAHPVIWCETSGRGHNRQDDFAPGVFWSLFSGL